MIMFEAVAMSPRLELVRGPGGGSPARNLKQTGGKGALGRWAIRMSAWMQPRAARSGGVLVNSLVVGV